MQIRTIIFLAIVGLILVLLSLGVNLRRELDNLSTDEGDNMTWTFLQVESEMSHLGRALAEQLLLDDPSDPFVRLRTDIAISRINLVASVRFRTLMQNDAEVLAMLDELVLFAEKAASIIDTTESIQRSDVQALANLVDPMHEVARRLSIQSLGRTTVAERDKRNRISSELAQMGGVSLAFLVAVLALLVMFDRLLRLARIRDAKLSATADRLQATLGASIDGIIVVDEKGLVVEVNEAAEHIFGWRKGELLGSRLENVIIPPSQCDAHATGMQRYLTTGEDRFVDVGRREMKALRRSGAVFPIELNITETVQDGQRVFVSYLRDISQRKIAEAELIDARDRAESADRAKSRFLSAMSHEMRTPLNGLLGVLDLLRTSQLDPQQARHVDVAAASGELLLEHVNEALDTTRIESGGLSFTRQRFDLFQTLERVGNVLRPLALEKSLGFHVEIDPALRGEFLGDAGRIGQIVTNLIGNGIKFTEEGTVSLYATGTVHTDRVSVRVQVSDTGPGIEEVHHEAIFEDFVALSRSEGRQARGDGLGLSISRKIARLMAGDLTVSSAPGQGATFTLTLPLVPVEAGDTDLEHDPSPALRSDLSRYVLVVEDNAISRAVLTEMLKGLGHKVQEARDGQECLDRVAEQAFDLIMMDISMPVLDGIEATRGIRGKEGPNQSTQILGLTAYGREEFLDKAAEAGMDAFVTKPIRIDTLREVFEGTYDLGISSDVELQEPVVPAEQAQPTIDEGVVAEFARTLGPERSVSTANKFFAELDASLGALRVMKPDTAESDIAETAHKLRGMSSLMGLTPLVIQVDKVAKARTTLAYNMAVSDLDQVGRRMRDDLMARLGTSENA